MGRANVYLPDDLERRVKAARIPISEVCQRALLAAVEAAEGSGHPFGPEIGEQFQRGWQAGVRWTEQAAPEALLTLLRDQRLEEIPAELLPADLYSLTQDQALAWEAGFAEAARAGVRLPQPAVEQPAGPSLTKATDSKATDSKAPDSEAAETPEQDEPAGDSPVARPVELGDDSGCQIGMTLDGHRVCFDPHAALRDGKSPLFAVLGHADERARLVLSVAQDAAARGSGVVLVDLSGQLVSRAPGLGKNVRIVRRPQAVPRLEDLVQGAVGLGGLWDTVAGLSKGAGLTQLFANPGEERIEPGYVTVISLAEAGQLGAALPVIQLLGQFATRADFPRLLHVDLPAGMTVPAPFAARLGRIVRTARQQNAAVGLSAENADTVGQLASGGALLSTAIAFATSSPVEADRLRALLGVDAPILLDPPGSSVRPSDQVWAAMRDLHGRLGQVRMEGW
ncbi:hypothetical protein [Jatrophihabitans sp.]|uniref:hypothetical protein n=1 Tax=Jatrophihabitans sp. TaxID=1932789 RepID=UPI002C510FAA|nr:hypothetical protein [Jatrophihabitans sp.]